jgi:hypothetical protein
VVHGIGKNSYINSTALWCCLCKAKQTAHNEVAGKVLTTEERLSDKKFVWFASFAGAVVRGHILN